VVPDLTSLRVPPRLTASSWHFRAPQAASRYAPRSIVALDSLTTQLTRVPRGDAMLIAAAYATADSVLRRDSTDAHIIALVGDSLMRGRSLTTFAWISVPRDTVTVSVELISASTRRAQRTRYTIDPIVRVHGAALSDLLLFDPGRSTGEDLDSALRAALAGLLVSARDPLGVFWTLDGVRPGPAWMSVTVEPAHVGFGRRLATRMHLAPELAPVRLRWQDRVDAEHPGHVTLRLPEKAHGTYRVTLTVQPVDAPALTSTRQIQVVP